MFNHKVSDLVLRAKQLADLEGTAFISYNEQFNLINENYKTLYSMLIDLGDKSFVSSFHCVSGVIALPSDFWQLMGVYAYSNGNLTVIPRRASNQSLNMTSYEVKNGCIHIYGSVEDVLVEYFQKPKLLTYKPADIVVDLPKEVKYLDCWKHTFLTYSNGAVSIYDLDEIKDAENIITINEADIKKAFILENFVVIAKNDGSLIVYDIDCGYTATLNTNTKYTPVITEEGNLLILTNGELSVISINVDGTYELEKFDDMNNYNSADYIYCNEDVTDFFYTSNGYLMHNGTALNVSPSKCAYKDGECYFLTNAGLNKVSAEDEIEVINQGSGIPVGFISLDYRTGYGFCTKKYNKYFIVPFVEDMELDFPNSFYYDCLSYLLAISYKMKQGADSSALESKLSQIKETFTDTLGSDSAQPLRMGNVY